MTFDCINNSSLKGELKEELTEAIQDRMDAMGSKYANNFKASVAIREVTEEAAEAIKHKKYVEHMRFMALNDLIERTDMDATDAARGLYTAYMLDAGEMRGSSNVEFRAKSIVADNTSLMPSLTELRPRVWSMGLGVQKKYNADILKEGMGISSGNPKAKVIAKEMMDSINQLVDLYRLAGGTLRKLDGWFLPQDWSLDAVAKTNRADWVDEAFTHVDTNKMVDQGTGAPLTEVQIKELLDFSYETITTDGLNKWKEAGAKLGFATKRDNARHLHFTPEGWITMNEKYGNPDTVNAFLGYRDRLANDVAIMQVLGPNPDWAFEKALAVMEKKVGSKEAASPDIKRLQFLHDYTLGRTNQVSSHKIHRADKAVRAVTMALLLPRAIIAAQADWSHQAMASVIQKSGMMGRLTEYVKLMTNSADPVEAAIHNKLVADTIFSTQATVSRLDSKLARTSSGAQNRALFTLEKSGLLLHTDAGRIASMTAHMRSIGKEMGKPWDKVDGTRKALMETYGITEDMWNNIITKLEPEVVDGKINILDLNALKNADETAFRRVHEMILAEGHRGVVSSDVRSQARLNLYQDYNEGTVTSPIINQLKMFKSFLVGAYGNIENIAKSKNISVPKKLQAYGTGIMVGTMLGAMALQAKQIIAGRDPFPMFDENGAPDWRFWTTAFMYAGVLPFFADIAMELMTGSADPYNPKSGARGFQDLSPTLGIVSRLGNELVADPLDELFNNDDPEAALDALGGGTIKLMKTGAEAFGANHILIQTALERLIWNPLEEAIDPQGFEDRVDRQKSYLEKQDRGFFWKPENALPERAPKDDSTADINFDWLLQ